MPMCCECLSKKFLPNDRIRAMLPSDWKHETLLTWTKDDEDYIMFRLIYTEACIRATIITPTEAQRHCSCGQPFIDIWKLQEEAFKAVWPSPYILLFCFQDYENASKPISLAYNMQNFISIGKSWSRDPNTGRKAL